MEHDALADFRPPPDARWEVAIPPDRAELVCHHDLAPLHAGGDPAVDGPRLRALADGYGLDKWQRAKLPALTAAHTRGMFDLLRTSDRQPWVRLHAEGHGDHWRPAADYIEQHLDAWRRALG